MGPNLDDFEHREAPRAVTEGVPNRHPLPKAARSLAAHQSGVLSRRQLSDLGVGHHVIDRLVDEGVLHRLTPGIVSHGPSVGWEGRAWAGVLLGGPHAVVGLQAAAHLWGIAKEAPDEVAIFAPVARSFRPGWRFIKAERQGVREPTRTRLEETLLDLCSEADADRITALLADAISARRTTAKRLLTFIAQRPTLPHRALVREILGDVSIGAHSALERRFLVDVERPHHLPTAARQAHAHHNHRSDALYEQFALLVELDSKAYHSGGAAFSDMTRDNAHALLGITTLRLGWQQVTAQPCETARMIGGYLMSRGWEGPIQPCQRCRLVRLT